MVIAWNVRFLRRAEKELEGIKRHEGFHIAQEIVFAALALADDPFPSDSLLLKRTRNSSRLRTGSGRYRLVYKVIEKQNLIIVTRVRLRSEAYRGL